MIYNVALSQLGRDGCVAKLGETRTLINLNDYIFQRNETLGCEPCSKSPTTSVRNRGQDSFHWELGKGEGRAKYVSVQMISS